MSWIFGAADVCNRIYGPIPGDIVETQGAHLLTRPSTPLIHDGRAPSNAPNFLASLDSKLRALLLVERIRRHNYGTEVADETVPGFTPDEVKAEYNLRMERVLREISEENRSPTPPTSPEVEEGQNHGEKQVKKSEMIPSPPASEEEKDPLLYAESEQDQRKRRREDPVALPSDALSLELSASDTLASSQTTQPSKRKRTFSDPGSNRTKKVKLRREKQDKCDTGGGGLKHPLY
ncbi:hypothetical protein CC80DRAFT_195469 [Byssothecium circinans]|uniref:Uncharacterized protein n=1 Tax=Byssothecium circinans TaxID=147558 RepID=A0A6A5UCH5_9PLEO|nr:hypothetical protein CC80DRAFT_195469 [Byssothecium circinans]